MMQDPLLALLAAATLGTGLVLAVEEAQVEGARVQAEIVSVFEQYQSDTESLLAQYTEEGR